VLLTNDGGVYYELAVDQLSGLPKSITVPASEIIHDMMVSLWHPLVGISPIYAAGLSATQGRRIQQNSTKFFNNMSRPSGVLTAPGRIDDETGNRLKKDFEDNFGGANLGRVMVGGSGLHYEPMSIPAEQAQLIEQLKWTVEDVARCFRYPLFKLGGALPVGSTIDALNQVYYSDCLQGLSEPLEMCLDEGLALPAGYHTKFDLDGLLRMDQMAQITMLAESVKSGMRAPDEARAKMNLPPVPGGKFPYLQQQNYSLEALAKRDAREDPFATKSAPAPAAAAAPPAANDAQSPEQVAAKLTGLILAELEADYVGT
jgi:HK97 family phage portal protein